MTPKKLLEIAEKETAHPLLLGAEELIPILKAAMKMADALENARPNGWRDYVGEEACKVALYMIELTIDGALSEWERLAGKGSKD